MLDMLHKRLALLERTQSLYWRPGGGKKDSLWWRDLWILGNNVATVGWFKASIRQGLKGGEGVDFWHHHWIGYQPLFMVFPLLYASCGAQHISVADLGSWLNNGWQWQLPWNTCIEDKVQEEANTLRDILRDVNSTQPNFSQFYPLIIFLLIIRWTLGQGAIMTRFLNDFGRPEYLPKCKSSVGEYSQMLFPLVDPCYSAMFLQMWMMQCALFVRNTMKMHCTCFSFANSQQRCGVMFAIGLDFKYLLFTAWRITS